MASAYAALLSLFHTLNQINIHPSPPISLDQSQVESLTENLSFLQHFLELHSNEEEDDELERRIAAAAYAAEDVIETHIRCDGGGNITSADLYGDLERVILQDMELINRDVVETIQQKVMMTPHLHTNSSTSGKPTSTLQRSTTPVFDDAMIYKVLDKIVGQQSSLQIVPIVGMGGIGKTTLAKYIYEKPLIVQRFDTLAWVTISQEYTSRNILKLLCQQLKGSNYVLSDQLSEDDIGLVIYKHLFGRRYFIVFDDIWSVEAWYMIKSYFPDHNNNGSRIIITTRLSNLALELSGCHGFQMQFLDEDKSWDMLCKIVFDKLDCPTELENIGREIAIKCRGLPLSIGVIGGLLRKSNMTRAYWMYTLENLNSLVNLENDEYAFRILCTSYKELPIHLKPCFLYMGIFPEDKDIKTSELIKLWVAEGILRPIDEKSLEEVAKEYLKELIDRNLLLVAKLKWNGEAKVCKIHDVLRDVCLREAQKQKFICVVRHQKDYTPQGLNKERRICIEYSKQDSSSVRLGSLRVYSSIYEVRYIKNVTHYNNVIFKNANLRYLSLGMELNALPSLFCRLWNLQTLKLGNKYQYPSSSPIIMRQLKIWEMPLLKHVIIYDFALPDPPNGEDSFVLKNLQTLSCVMNLKFSEEVIKRIPNVKKLKLIYKTGRDHNDKEGLFIKNIGRLQKLEYLSLDVDSFEFEEIRRDLVSFPHSLKKLSLYGTELSWEELTMRIGSLPHLQFLRLDYNACRGSKWETVEGHFCSLRILEIWFCQDLKYWDTDSTHFPRLEHLRLSFIYNLEEIPSSIGDIPTLKSILLEGCSESAYHSAKRIKVEQEENENEDLQIIIGDKVVQVDSDVEEDGADLDVDDQVDLNEDNQVDLDDLDEDNRLFSNLTWMKKTKKTIKLNWMKTINLTWIKKKIMLT